MTTLEKIQAIINNKNIKEHLKMETIERILTSYRIKFRQKAEKLASTVKNVN